MRIHCRLRRRTTTANGYVFLVTLAMALIMWYFFRVSYRKEVLESLRKRNTTALVLPNFDTTIIQTLNQCKPNQNTIILAVIVIVTKPEDWMIRNQVRNHWNGWGLHKNSLHGLVRRIFFVGMPKDNDLNSLLEEAAKYDDIVVDAMIESYYALTLKTLRILKWFLKHCMDAHFFVKTDVDFLIHLPNLIKFLQSLESHGQEEAQKFIGGDLGTNANPYTNEREKWYMPPEILPSIDVKPGSAYPDFVFGGFYILSVPLIPALYKESLRVPLIHFEDLFLTGLIANRNLGYKLTKIPNVFNNGLVGCIYSGTHYVYNPNLIACGFLDESEEFLNLYYENYQSQYRESNLDQNNN